MDKIIAITGGIGSGKSSVSKIIKSLGYKVFSADEVYASLILNKDFVLSIYNALGIKTASEDFDRKLVAEKVFNDSEKLKILNDITHPAVMKKLLELSKSCKGVVFNEVPLLFESGYESAYDNIIVVKRSLGDRVKSVSLRDNLDESEVLLRINNQFDYENNLNIEHTLIVNDGSLSELESKVKVAIEKVIK
jgi:dephospho-CoA kinase